MSGKNHYDAGSSGWPNPWEGFLPRRTLLMLRAYSTAPVTPPDAAPESTTLAQDLDGIAAELSGCTRCKLAQGRKTIVFGEGNPRARLMFIGEGPGENEDIQGRPFVGKAGDLLNKMIEAMGYKRSDVYIANVVKCRPPGNRNPEPDEIASCSPFLMRQIQAIQPEVIVALGKFAAQTLLQTETPISRLRGSFKKFQVGEREIPLMPTFHPAYLLRNPESKREAWEDLKQVRAKLQS